MFLRITAEHQDCPVFTVFPTIKTSSQNMSIINACIDFAQKSSPVPRNTAASKISNGVKALLLQLRCHCIPDHNKFSYLSNKAVVVIFPNLC